MERYEIWVGKYNLGQGFGRPTSPQKIGEEFAINFKVACVKHELKSMLKSIEKQEVIGDVDDQSLNWFFNQRTLTNDWLGKYFSTQEEAAESFK